ncbi:peptidase M14 [bacterium]|nr:peptidase M14 [bacterium]
MSADLNHTILGTMNPGHWSLASVPHCTVQTIGQSRQGLPLFGLTVGSGPIRVSITAGAHADEPVGPRTAVYLAAEMAVGDLPWARQLAERCTFWIAPHVNPDGDLRNANWQEAPGDFEACMKHVHRELPGDDVEFNYPRSEDDEEARPENLAVAKFLRSANGPFDLHLSLHSMGVAEGAWFLICREWVERARNAGMLERLANIAGRHGVGLHDMERHGEKGFSRIAPGFCTTPRSDAMREFFLEQNDLETAALFRPSSMEFVQSLGGDPLCLVSEMPYFILRAAESSDEPLDSRPYFRLRAQLPHVRAALEHGDENPLDEVVKEFGIEPMSWESHRDLQLAFIREGVRLVGMQ